MLRIFAARNAANRLKHIRELLPLINRALEIMHPNERAAVLMLANAQVALAARVHGKTLLTAPARSPEAAGKAADELISIYARQTSIIEKAPGNLARYFRAHVQATLVALATVSVGLDPKTQRPLCARIWKALLEDRGQAEAALVWLRRAEASTGVPCFPDLVAGKAMSDLDVLALSQTYPPFLKTRKATPAKPSQGNVENQ